MKGPATGTGEGLFHTLRNASYCLVTLVRLRLELAGTELEEQARDAFACMLWALVALFLAALGVVLAVVLLVLLAGDTYRPMVITLLTGVCVLGAILAGGVARRRNRRRTTPLAATLKELQRDAEALGAGR